jgi:L-threonylcarbamoyladenylate synthase
MPIESATPESVAEAVRLLRLGRCIGLPTETVYGLAADGLNPRAVARIFSIKERPTFDPLILHIPPGYPLERICRPDPVALELAARFWPGPLTLLLPRTGLVPDLVTSGLPQVAVRCPSHPVARQILEAFGGPLAAPSANKFGRISPTTARHVEDDLGPELDLVIDGGPCIHGLESTIIDPSSDPVRLLRRGAILPENLGKAWTDATATSLPSAPGMLEHHYAPRKPLHLLTDAVPPGTAWPAGAALLAWDSIPFGFTGPSVVLTPTGSDIEAAARLFSALRELDASPARQLLAEPIPVHGLGAAILDRLRRASSGTCRVTDGAWTFQSR